MNPFSHDPPTLKGGFPATEARHRLHPPTLDRENLPSGESDLLWEELGYFTEEQLQVLLDCLGYLE